MESSAPVGLSELTTAIEVMRDRMLDAKDPWLGDDRDEKHGRRTKPLSPNTVEDIVNIARAVVSPTTRLYQRDQLKHLAPIVKVMNEEWWPEIQKHCKTDLRLKGSAGSSAWRDAWEKYGPADTEQIQGLDKYDYDQDDDE